MPKRLLAISISGGGALGIGPLQFMCRLEQDIGKKLGDLAIAFAGTSTGAIIAAGLDEGYSAHDLFDLYKSNLTKIFTKYPWYKRITAGCPTYDNSYLKKMLSEKFNGKCGDWKKPIYIPVTHMNGKSEEKVWDLGDVSTDKWFAVLTSTAAPTYFDVVKDSSGNAYIDGGMWCNSPVMALESGLQRSEYAGNFRILDFATGMCPPPRTDNSNKTLVGWAEYIFSDWVAKTGNSNYYEACANIGTENVFRCMPTVDKVYKMDDVSAANINKVIDIWDKYYESVRSDVLKFVKNS